MLSVFDLFDPNEHRGKNRWQAICSKHALQKGNVFLVLFAL